MQFEQQSPRSSTVKVKPRLVLHGGAGNIIRRDFPPETYEAYRSALISIVSIERFL